MIKRTKLSCDVLIVGAGPAGIAAAVSAAKSEAKVIVVDDNPQPGGQIWRAAASEIQYSGSSKREAALWLHRLRASGATLLMSTRVVAAPAREVALAEDENNAIEISYRSAILATGARELMLPFPGWTLPNVMAAGGLQAMVKSGLSVQGKNVVVAGTGPLLLAVAAFLKANGAKVKGVYEQAPLSRLFRFGISLLARPATLSSAIAYKAALGATPYHCGWWPVSAQGEESVTSITMSTGAQSRTLDCDFVACGFHLVPNTELQAAFGCALTQSKIRVDESQQTSVANVFSVGESTGIGGLDVALVEGEIAGYAAVGKMDQAKRLIERRSSLQALTLAMERAFALRQELRDLAAPDTIVCRCEDVRWSELREQSSTRPAKLYTRCGMGPCQGRVCGAALQFLLGWSAPSPRPPVFPVRLSTLVSEPQLMSEEKL